MLRERGDGGWGGREGEVAIGEPRRMAGRKDKDKAEPREYVGSGGARRWSAKEGG